MYNKFVYIDGAFEVDPNTNMAKDFEPAISIDHINVLNKGIKSLTELLGITAMKPMAAGNVVTRYKTEVTKGAQVAEGEIIPLSKTTRKPLDPLVLTFKKYRKQTTLEAVQKNKAIALNESDDLLLKDIRRDIIGDFYDMIGDGAGQPVTAGTNLQSAAAQAWGALTVYFEDEDATPIFWLNPLDVADYLGTANISVQEKFGLKYIENFLGLGTAILNSRVDRKTVVATVTQNLNGVYAPANGDAANTFGLTFDETGLVGITHNVNTDNASVDTLLVSAVLFYPEDNSGIFVSSWT